MSSNCLTSKGQVIALVIAQKHIYKTFFLFIYLFMSNAHHGINSSTQKYQSTQSIVVLTSCHQDSGSPSF